MINEAESDKAFSQHLIAIPDLVAKVGPRYWWNEGARWFDAWLSGKVASAPRPVTLCDDQECPAHGFNECEVASRCFKAAQEEIVLLKMQLELCREKLACKDGRPAKRGGPCASCGASNSLKTCKFVVNTQECEGEFSICKNCWCSGVNNEGWNERITQQIVARLKTP
jgi:hypothetical protein